LGVRKTTLCVLVIALTAGVACSAGSGGRTRDGKLVEAQVNVFAWNDARTAAMLIDRNGRRTGWNGDRPIDQIRGCTYEAGSEVGIPDESVPDTLEEAVSADTAVAGPELTPMEHHFKIFNDGVTEVGLIEQTECELRLDPVVAGKVQLTLSARGTGVSGCADTTSVWVKPGVPLRWRLSWKVTGDSCVVRISSIAVRGPR
jgi:hypothetical protein